MLCKEEEEEKTCTNGCLLELLTLLLPPLPGLEEASQSGKLAAAADGWSVGAGEKGLGAHGGQPLHFLSCKGTKRREGKQSPREMGMQRR